MRRAPKPARAARSASDTQLRQKAVSSVKSGGKGKKGRRLLSAVTAARVSKILEGGQRKSENKRDDSDVIDVEEVNPFNRNPAGRQFTKKPASSTTSKTRPGIRKAPAAIKGPSATPKPSSKKPKGPKKEKTPGVQRVFKATPVVDLNEGPDFGNIKHSIEETFQPKQSRKKKDAQ